MPLSHKLKTIFIHIPKAAGTSINRALSSQDPGLDFIGRAPLEITSTTGEYWQHHIPLCMLKTLVPMDIWTAYFKFSVVRNPFDLMVSYYSYHQRRVRESEEFRFRHPDIVRMFAGTPSFEQWLRAGVQIRPQLSYVIDTDGRIGIDYIGHFETLDRDFDTIAHALNMPVTLPHFNRSNHQRWPSYYSSLELVEIVRRKFAEDFEAFDYSDRVPPN